MAELRIKIAIDGTTPLLCNRFGDEAAMDASGETPRQSGLKDKGTPREQAQGKLYISEKTTKPMIPGPNLFRCLIDAGTFFKVGKSKVTTIKNSMVPACLTMCEMEVAIQHKDPWTVDTRPVRNPSTGGRFNCHRPSFHDWRLEFEVVLDTSIIGVKLFREIVDAAGKRIGLGDFRPDRKGPFGRFVVTKWVADEPAKRNGVGSAVGVA
jgi:hypothetical protein